jgi:hypothetical protein
MVIKLSSHTSPGWVNFWEVPSHSKPSQAYIVAQRPNGTFGCNCPRWKFHQDTECKHIQDVKRWMIVPDLFKKHAQITSPEKLSKILNAFSAIELD